MNGHIFRLTIRQQWRNALLWGIGLGLLNLVTVTLVPDMEALRQYEQLFATLPPGLMQAFGIDVAQQFTPDSFMVPLLYANLLLFIAVYAVLAGMSITANEEDEGIMDMLMTLPVPRHALMAERLLAHYALTVVVTVLMFIGFLIGTRFITLELNLGLQFQVIMSLLLPMCVMITATALLGVLLRQRGRALGLAGMFVIASFFLDTLGAAVADGVMPMLRPLSFFSYNTPTDIVANGVQWGEVGLLLLLIGLLAGGALWLWERRDIGL